VAAAAGPARRLAIARPERLDALIVQNAAAHEDGLGPLWKTRREFWADRQAHEAALRENFFSYAATRQRHVGTSPNTENYDPAAPARRRTTCHNAGAVPSPTAPGVTKMY